MKFTVGFITLLSVSLAVIAKEDPKDKREAPVGYPGSSHSSSLSSYQPQSQSHGDASSISVGAGYSIGGAKPSFSFGGHGSGGLQYQSEGLSPNSHASIQLAPITLQPQHGIAGSDLNQIMSQLSHSLNSGALTLQPSNTVAEFHDSGHGGQQQFVLQPQFSYGGPKLQQYSLGGAISSVPAYSAGSKGLSSYSSTGPVLFNPAEGHGSSAALTAGQSAGHSLGESGALSYGGSGHSFGGLSLGNSGHSFSGPEISLGSSGLSLNGLAHSFGSEQSLGGASHSFGGHSLGSSGASLGDAGHSLGGSGHSLGGASHAFGGHSLGSSGLSLGSSGNSLGGSGHSFGGSPGSLGGYYKVSSGSHGHGSAPSKSSFKPSTFLGASVHSDSGLSGSHGFPSFGGSHGGLAFGQGSSYGGSSYNGIGGSSKHISPLYTKGFGSALDSAAAYSSSGHLATPPGTTYGFPTSSYSGAVHAASSASPQYYVSSSKYPSFSEGSSFKGPISSYSSLSHSSGPKYSFGGHSSSSRYGSPKDSHGAYSEQVYNTIKYSEELKPRAH